MAATQKVVQFPTPAQAPYPAETISHPGLYTEVLAPGHVPVAFTNPVYIDVDGNGVFDPPGLGASASAVRISRE
jgi:hypothetical protein